MVRYPCDFSPVCLKTFDRQGRKDKHMTNEHPEAKQKPFFCPECTDRLHLYSSAASLRNHSANHVKASCPACGEMTLKTNLSRHRKESCQARDSLVSSTTGQGVDSSDSIRPIPFDCERVFHPIKGSQARRSKHTAFPKTMSGRVLEFLEWYKSPISLGRINRGKHSPDFVSKFRTVLGKMAAFFGTTAPELDKMLNGSKLDVLAVFELKRFDLFVRSLGRGVDNEMLSSNTSYNYLRTLVLFLQWLCDLDGFRELKPTLKMIGTTAKMVSKKRKLEARASASQKAQRLEDAPSVPEFVKWIHEDLRPTFEAEVESFRTSKTFSPRMYTSGRDLFLVVLLFETPPQRLQLFTDMRVSKRDEVAPDGPIRFRISHHKTSGIYGDAFMYIPDKYKSLFECFLCFRRLLLLHQAKAMGIDRTREDHVFVDMEGRPERYLLSRFQTIVDHKFKKHVTIHDCRSIFIIQASQAALSLSDMFDLARAMNHSFAMQQQVYRAQTVGQRQEICERIAQRVASSSTASPPRSDSGHLLGLPVIQTEEEQIAAFICSHGATGESVG